jgi:cytochrome P450
MKVGPAANPSKYDFASQAVRDCPYPFYDALLDSAPVYQIPGRDDYLVSRYEDVAWCLQQTALLSSRRWDDPSFELSAPGQRYPLGPSISEADPPEHTRNRALTIRAFTPGRLRSYEPLIASNVDELLDMFSDRGHAEWVSEYASKLPMLVICDILGLDRANGPNLKRWADDYAEYIGKFASGSQTAELRASIADFFNFIGDEIEKRRAYPTADVLSEISNARDDDGEPIDMTTLVNIGRVLIMAGHETTAFLLANSLYLLLKDRGVYEAVVADPNLIRRLIEETLRLESPNQWVSRQVMREFVLDGITIPAGSRVILLTAAANRDESKFECPADVDLTRRNVQNHLGFGLGIHFCLGAPLARLEARLTFEHLLTRLDNIRIDAKAAITMRGGARSIYVPLLPITFDRRLAE